MKRIIVFLAVILLAGSAGTALGWTTGSNGLLSSRAHRTSTATPTPVADAAQPAHSKRILPRPTFTLAPEPSTKPTPTPTSAPAPTFSPKPSPTYTPRPTLVPKPYPTPIRCDCGRWDNTIHASQPDVMCPMIYCPDYTL